MHTCWVDQTQLWFAVLVTGIIGVETLQQRTMLFHRIIKEKKSQFSTANWCVSHASKDRKPRQTAHRAIKAFLPLVHSRSVYFILDSTWKSGNWKPFLLEIKIKLLHSVSLGRAGNGSVKSSFQTIFWLNHSDLYAPVFSGDAAKKKIRKYLPSTTLRGTCKLSSCWYKSPWITTVIIPLPLLDFSPSNWRFTLCSDMTHAATSTACQREMDVFTKLLTKPKAGSSATLLLLLLQTKPSQF